MYMINILIYNRLCRLEARWKPEVEYSVSVIGSFWLLLYTLTILVGAFQGTRSFSYSGLQKYLETFTSADLVF